MEGQGPGGRSLGHTVPTLRLESDIEGRNRWRGEQIAGAGRVCARKGGAGGASIIYDLM